VTFSSNQRNRGDQNNYKSDCRDDHDGQETRISFAFLGSGIVARRLDLFLFRSPRFTCWIHRICHAGLDATGRLNRLVFYFFTLLRQSIPAATP